MALLTSQLILDKDINNNVTYIIGFSPIGFTVNLAPSVAQSLVVPPNMVKAIFSYSVGTNVFVNINTAATIPTGAFTATTEDINPQGRYVVPGSTLSFISDTAAYVKVSFYTSGLNAGMIGRT
jgi:hypothetical protein